MASLYASVDELRIRFQTEKEMSLTSEMHQLADKQSEDRISSLPSSLIGYILSFLPTKDAVATSVLSTTWREFWKLITRLDIDDDLLTRPLNKDRTELLQAEFIDFVYRVLLVGRFPWIEAFCLRCSHSYTPHYIPAWLDSVLKSNVQELDVSVRFEVKDSLVLPRRLFTCPTLVKLQLRGSFYMNVPASVSFPCLKLVSLFWVKFSDDDSITRFLSGCPVLEDLSLLKCMGKDVKVVKIYVPSLTSLTLVYLRLMECFKKGVLYGDVPTLRIVLDTPFLRKIYIRDALPHGYVFLNINQLTSAVLKIPSRLEWGWNWVVPFKGVHHAAAKDLLQGISKVRKLKFYTLAIDSRLYLPNFENLKDLEFGTHKNIKLQELVKLLETSPVLSSLRIKLNPACKTRMGNEENDMLELDASQSVPNCLLLHLKTVEIVHLRREVVLVEYLLRNAQLLEKLRVRLYGYKKELPEAGELLLLTLPRASSACDIEIS